MYLPGARITTEARERESERDLRIACVYVIDLPLTEHVLHGQHRRGSLGLW